MYYKNKTNQIRYGYILQVDWISQMYDSTTDLCCKINTRMDWRNRVWIRYCINCVNALIIVYEVLVWQPASRAHHMWIQDMIGRVHAISTMLVEQASLSVQSC